MGKTFGADASLISHCLEYLILATVRGSGVHAAKKRVTAGSVGFSDIWS